MTASETMSLTARKRLLWVIIVLAAACLGVWSWMPIFPDEIAFRQHLGRAVADHGVIYGLFEACPSNFKTVPLLLAPAARLTAWVADTFSPRATRVLPFLTLLSVVALSARYALRGTTPVAALLTLASFIGVAGSGMVLVRYETPLQLDLLCCFAAANVLIGRDINKLTNGLAFLALVFATTCSLYAHSQGLLFVPLTLYLSYRLLSPLIGGRSAMAVVALLLITMADASLRFQHLTCTEHPEIEAFWRSMMFDVNDLRPDAILPWLVTKITRYTENFLYKSEYTIFYLPGVSHTSSFVGKAAASIMNFLVLCILGALAFLSVLAAALAPFLLVRRYFGRRPQASSPDDLHIHFALLLLVPALGLFLYDPIQAFYRAFTLNELAAVGLAMLLSRFMPGRLHQLIRGFSALSALVVVACLGANAWWFTKKLRAGYEGPSISLRRDWRAINADVHSLAEACGMDLSKGRIIIDDGTYDSLKLYPVTYPSTYLQLQGWLTHTAVPVLARSLPANYAITFCPSMTAIGIVPQQRRGDLCCAVLGE